MSYVLIVEDESKMRHLLSIMLEGRGHRVDQAGDGLEALKKIRENPYDLVISDIKMPRMDGIELLNTLRQENNACPVVFITAFATVESAVDAMRQGAVDFITKPFEEDRILLTIERTLFFSRIIAENTDLRQQIHKMADPGDIVYVSEKMKTLIEMAARVARSDSAVLITGESGTGKELIARFIHHAGARAKGRFVPVNCAAISATLVESELFGYEKGAFTGADKKTEGKFEYASGGTLFLDEIGDLPIEAQAKLLRTLQEKKVQRVGGNREIDVDVRVICATNQDLDEQVRNNRFRQDLFFRINVFPLQTPPLRDRREDVAPLALHFIRKASGGKEVNLTEGARRILVAYPWPGNVRELANAMERALILSMDKPSIDTETLSFLRKPSEPFAGDVCFRLPADGIDLEELEKDLVKQALEATNSNQTIAARMLGLTRAKFRVLMKQAGAR